MKSIRIFIGGVLLLFLTTTFLSAQDIHFSQFISSPLNMNPANTGDFEGDFRFVANRKSQWASISTPYITNSFSFDTKFFFNEKSGNRINLGLLVNNDVAGDSKFGKTGISLNLGYTKDLKDSTILLTIATAAGFFQHSIDYSRLTFNSNFNGFQYEPGSGGFQNIGSDKISYLDFNVGGNIQYIFPNRVGINIGGAFWHISKPNQSFSDGGSAKLERKIVFQGGFKIPTSWSMAFYPSFIFNRQGKYSESLWGGNIQFITDSKAFPAFYIGSWYRWRDAVIIRGAIDFNNLSVGLSYDINTSKLVNATSGDGGLEISIIYILNSLKLLNAPIKKCKDYL